MYGAVLTGCLAWLMLVHIKRVIIILQYGLILTVFQRADAQVDDGGRFNEHKNTKSALKMLYLYKLYCEGNVSSVCKSTCRPHKYAALCVSRPLKERNDMHKFLHSGRLLPKSLTCRKQGTLLWWKSYDKGAVGAICI